MPSPATAAELRLRAAIHADIPALRSLIVASVRELSVGYYTAEQVESGLRHLYGVDSQLVADGTYYVIENADGIAAAGGWSRRRTLYGGDQMKEAEDPLLDPMTDAARIRAFFVHPAWARRGLGRRLFAACEAAARAAGFRRFELAATLPGEPLYAALGFVARERGAVTFPDGVDLPCVMMERAMDPAPPRSPAAIPRRASSGR